MVAPYSLDLRQRIVQAKLSGQHTNKEISKIFSVSITSIKNYFRKYKNNESLESNSPTGRIPTINDEDKKLISQYIQEYPDATLDEYCRYLSEDTNKTITPQNMHYIIKKLNITRKKKPVRPRKGAN